MTPRSCLVLLVVWLLGSAAPTAAHAAAPAPLDLAAMTLTPADLAAVGWDGLGLASGQTLSATDLADRAVWPAGAGEEQDAVYDALLKAGCQQAYGASFSLVRPDGHVAWRGNGRPSVGAGRLIDTVRGV